MGFSRTSLVFLTVVAVVASGLMSGLLFAFSNFVMRSLAEQPAQSAVRSMQAINLRIINPLFVALFLGAAISTAALAIASIARVSQDGGAWLLGGSGLYLLGTLGVTLVCNLPLNDQLASLSPASAEAAAFWPHYLTAWLRWNHVRTAAAIAAMVSLLVGLVKFRYL